MAAVDINSLVSGLNNLATNMTALDTLIKAFTHSTFDDIRPMIKLQNATVDLENEISSLTNDFAQKKLDLGETLKLADPLAKLSPPILAALVDIGLKKREFDKAILGLLPVSPLVKGHLHKLKDLLAALLKQIETSMDSLAGVVIEPIVLALKTAFDAQINVTYMLDCDLYVSVKLGK